MTGLSVQAAITRIIGELPAIGKDARFSGSGVSYSYRGIEAITAHLQPLLAKYGVVIVPFTRLVSMGPALDAKPGWYDAVIETTWTITGPDGSQLEAQTMGIGRDNSDKACNKAASQAYKYLLLQVFCVADKADDTDGIDNYGAVSGEDTAQTAKANRIHDLYDRVKAAKDTPWATALVKLAAENGDKSLTEKALAADDTWAELVAATLNTPEGEL